MASNALKKITTRAKQIYKKSGTWKSAIKKAGAEYRSGKISGAKSKRKAAVKRVKKLHRAEGKAMRALGARKRRRRVGGTMSAGAYPSARSVGGVRRRVGGTLSAAASGGIMGMSASQHITHAKEKLHEKIAAAYGKIFSAKTKLAKRKLNKSLSELKSRYRKLC